LVAGFDTPDTGPARAVGTLTALVVVADTGLDPSVESFAVPEVSVVVVVQGASVVVAVQ